MKRERVVMKNPSIFPFAARRCLVARSSRLSSPTRSRPCHTPQWRPPPTRWLRRPRPAFPGRTRRGAREFDGEGESRARESPWSPCAALSLNAHTLLSSLLRTPTQIRRQRRVSGTPCSSGEGCERRPHRAEAAQVTHALSPIAFPMAPCPHTSALSSIHLTAPSSPLPATTTASSPPPHACPRATPS